MFTYRDADSTFKAKEELRKEDFDGDRLRRVPENWTSACRWAPYIAYGLRVLPTYRQEGQAN